jgi:hypothetical protein
MFKHGAAWLHWPACACGWVLSVTMPHAVAEPVPACSMVMRDCTAAQQTLAVPRAPSNALRDRTKAQLDRAQRRVDAARQSEGGSALKLDRVEIEGEREATGDAVKSAFERNLPALPRSGIEEWVRDDGARCTVNHDCRGIFCMAVCTRGAGSMGNNAGGPGGFSVIQR